MSQVRVLIVGATGGSNIGESLLRAARDLGLEVSLCDTNQAWRLGTLAQSLAWHFAGQRPLRLGSFNKLILRTCCEFRPSIMIVTGRGGVTANALRNCRREGIRTVNFLTDDPFNPKVPSPWFRQTLQLYDTLFTPRRSNFEALRATGSANVCYLPFGYDPHLFYKIENSSEIECDLFFAGHVEASRLEYLSSAISNGLRVRLYGNGWKRNRITMPAALGEANIATIRREAAVSKIALCCVRHDNRDGHSMRTFELPAVGACMLVEDTGEHREIFGSEGIRVVYFSSPAQMLERARALLAAPSERLRMRNSVHDWITRGCHTYRDRLKEMLAFAPA